MRSFIHSFILSYIHTPYTFLLLLFFSPLLGDQPAPGGEKLGRRSGKIGEAVVKIAQYLHPWHVIVIDSSDKDGVDLGWVGGWVGKGWLKSPKTTFTLGISTRDQQAFIHPPTHPPTHLPFVPY